MHDGRKKGDNFFCHSHRSLTYSLPIIAFLGFAACAPSNNFSGSSPSKKSVEPDQKGSENVEKEPGSEELGGAGAVVSGDISGLAKICSEKAKKSRSLVVSLPSNSGARCPFGEGDNLPVANGLITARIERDFPLDIPKSHKVCSMQANAANQLMRYDDHLFLTLNKNILLASTTEANKFVSGASELKQFDWEKIKGGNSSDSPSYCGPGITCSLPRTEVQGQFSFSISEEASPKIFAPLLGSDLKFGLVLTGDNDPTSDCQLNTPLQINVTYDYVE